MTNGNLSDYKNMRALLLLRVSTPYQEQNFGWQAQEKEIREKLVNLISLKVNEDKHVIRDTYTGLEFRERPALNRILEMAKKKEFDILCMDVLDRLGRKGLERELFRMQLKELGIKILTTDPDEHADDDSLIGEMIRLFKGYQAEEELNNTRRRTMNGRRAKVEGRLPDGTIGPKKIIGSGPRLYGYNFTLDDRGKRSGFEIKDEVIHVDENGIKWTEPQVIRFMYESIDAGMPIREITRTLNQKGIPTPSVVNKTKLTKRAMPPTWYPSVVSKILNQPGYYGEYHQFKSVSGERKPGQRRRERTQAPEENQVIIGIPAIISKELAEKVQARLQRNKALASRNNKVPQDTLLRVGLATCGICGANMYSHHMARTRKTKTTYEIYYTCNRNVWTTTKHKSVCISANIIDSAAWNTAMELLRDPNQVDKQLEKNKREDPTIENRKSINKKLSEIRQQQNIFRQQLSKLIIEGKLDKGTEDFLAAQLNQLVHQEKKWQEQLEKDTELHVQWSEVQEGLNKFHKRCLEIKERLNDPNYKPDYEDKRDIIEFFGITVEVWDKENETRFKVSCNPPDVVFTTCKIVGSGPDRLDVQSSRSGRHWHHSLSQPQQF